MTGYHQRSIQNYTTIVESLTNLTRKGKPDIIEWTENAKLSYESLKGALTSATVMRSPHFTKTFILQTDASNLKVGALLSLGDEDYSIAYFSRKLLDRDTQ